MPVNVKGKPYLQVVERLNTFRELYPITDSWGITTEVIHHDDNSCAIKASIFSPDGIVIATGTAEEQRNDGPVNQTSALENCETSAVGRALSFAGFPGSEIASAEEVLRAIDQQQATAPAAPKVFLTPAGKESLTAETEEPVEVGDWRTVAIHFGKNKGKKLDDLSEKQLSWYQGSWDPTKDRDGNTHSHPISDDDKLLRAALDASVDDDHQAAQSMSSDDEIPF